jgi:predicted glutamine amidotransferase
MPSQQLLSPTADTTPAGTINYIANKKNKYNSYKASLGNNSGKIIASALHNKEKHRTTVPVSTVVVLKKQ